MVKMDDDNLPALGPTVDLTKMAALNQRRSVTFMNHFITHTSSFLNKFANMAEDKLAQQSLEMQRMEIALNILEAKIASIPGLDDIRKEEPAATTTPDQQPPSSQEPTPGAPAEETNIPQESGPVVDPNVLLVKDDPRYARFLKMVSVGVPKMAVGNKMAAEGLDPNLLDTPDAPVPDGGQAPEESDNESESLSSDDDFSD